MRAISAFVKLLKLSSTHRLKTHQKPLQRLAGGTISLEEAHGPGFQIAPAAQRPVRHSLGVPQLNVVLLILPSQA